jgi:preprotein translocase subunit SecG
MAGYFINLLIIVQVLCALAIIVLVLLQQGKGADMGAAFGSGASGSLFGATGSANFLSRMTAVSATIFFVATLALAYLGTTGRVVSSGGSGGGVMSEIDKAAPAKDAAGEAPKDVPPASPAPAPAAPAQPKAPDVPK